MTPKQLLYALHVLKLNKQEASELVGYDTSTIRRWQREELPIPRAVAHLLSLMITTNTTPDQLRAIGKRKTQ